MYQLVFTNRFKKDTKLLQKRGFNMEILKQIILYLEKNGFLDSTWHPHKLGGNYSDFWEAHLQPDWLIIWKSIADKSEILLVRTGSHSDPFKS